LNAWLKDDVREGICWYGQSVSMIRHCLCYCSVGRMCSSCMISAQYQQATAHAINIWLGHAGSPCGLQLCYQDARSAYSWYCWYQVLVKKARSCCFCTDACHRQLDRTQTHPNNVKKAVPCTCVTGYCKSRTESQEPKKYNLLVTRKLYSNKQQPRGAVQYSL
jgi:hypothetical protein